MAIRGTSATQDGRYLAQEKKQLAKMTFPSCFTQRVDMRKVQREVINQWVTERITQLLGFEDDIVVSMAINLLEPEVNETLDPKQLQVALTGFLENQAGGFMQELWQLLLSAQSNSTGIPSAILDKKKQEIQAIAQEKEQLKKVLDLKRAEGRVSCARDGDRGQKRQEKEVVASVIDTRRSPSGRNDDGREDKRPSRSILQRRRSPVRRSRRSTSRQRRRRSPVRRPRRSMSVERRSKSPRSRRRRSRSPHGRRRDSPGRRRRSPSPRTRRRSRSSPRGRFRRQRSRSPSVKRRRKRRRVDGWRDTLSGVVFVLTVHCLWTLSTAGHCRGHPIERTNDDLLVAETRRNARAVNAFVALHPALCRNPSMTQDLLPARLHLLAAAR
uniref:PWI domain-containing protein n=1 Tax=Peronospora matthiolae TaxID=2874970 RepID=A0AAV1TLK6_9STRA